MKSMPAAGLPWFMTIFGRDSPSTPASRALPFIPELAATTLEILATLQSRADDPSATPSLGKILHELRFGEMTAFEDTPHSPYYGSADATPLFLILMEEYERWTGDRALVKSPEWAARAAIRWIDRYGDRDGDGYIEYERRKPPTVSKTRAGRTWRCDRFRGRNAAPTPGDLRAGRAMPSDAGAWTARLAREVWTI